MKLGVEKKEERWKLYVLGVLAVGGVFAVYYNLTPDYPTSGSSAPAPKAAIATPAVVPDIAPPPVRRRANGRGAGDFRPKLKDNRAENRIDLTKIDPTINLGLLTRVQNVSLEGGVRNIFQFGAAAPVAPVTPFPKVPVIHVGPVTSAPPPPVNPGIPPPPQAPPIPFKYYGYSSVKGETRKRAFFLDGEDIIVVWEGDMIKNRYKVVHVGLRAVDMEDTQFQAGGKQSLPLAEDLAG